MVNVCVVVVFVVEVPVVSVVSVVVVAVIVVSVVVVTVVVKVVSVSVMLVSVTDVAVFVVVVFVCVVLVEVPKSFVHASVPLVSFMIMSIETEHVRQFLSSQFQSCKPMHSGSHVQRSCASLKLPNHSEQCPTCPRLPTRGPSR